HRAAVKARPVEDIRLEASQTGPARKPDTAIIKRGGEEAPCGKPLGKLPVIFLTNPHCWNDQHTTGRLALRNEKVGDDRLSVVGGDLLSLGSHYRGECGGDEPTGPGVLTRSAQGSPAAAACFKREGMTSFCNSAQISAVGVCNSCKEG